MPVFIAIALGGGLGALTRWGVDALVERRSLSVFPFGTLVVNVSGCFLIGLVVAALVDRHHTPHWLRAGLVIGVLGAYTTFSTFAQETLDLARGDELAVASVNAALSVALGLAAVGAGTAAGRLL
jgi:CrcB protein